MPQVDEGWARPETWDSAVGGAPCFPGRPADARPRAQGNARTGDSVVRPDLQKPWGREGGRKARENFHVTTTICPGRV